VTKWKRRGWNWYRSYRAPGQGLVEELLLPDWQNVVVLLIACVLIYLKVTFL